MTFGFLDLPIEVRLQIYQNYFVGDSKLGPTNRQRYRLPTKNHSSPTQPKSPTLSTTTTRWTLLETNKQIYNEAIPELYNAKEFYFDVSTSFYEIIETRPTFRQNVRHLCIYPSAMYPMAADLISCPELQTFTITSVPILEPLMTKPGQSLSHKVLTMAMRPELHMYFRDAPVVRMDTLRTELMGLTSTTTTTTTTSTTTSIQANPKQKPKLKLLIRLNYSYVEKAKHPDGWGGKTAKRNRKLTYDYDDDTFTILEPDEDEIRDNSVVIYPDPDTDPVSVSTSDIDVDVDPVAGAGSGTGEVIS